MRHGTPGKHGFGTVRACGSGIRFGAVCTCTDLCICDFDNNSNLCGNQNNCDLRSIGNLKICCKFFNNCNDKIHRGFFSNCNDKIHRSFFNNCNNKIHRGFHNKNNLDNLCCFRSTEHIFLLCDVRDLHHRCRHNHRRRSRRKQL